MGLPLYQPAGSILYLSELDPEPGEAGIFTRRLGGPTPSPKHRRRDHRTAARTTPTLTQPPGDYHPDILREVVIPGPSRYDPPCNGPRDHDQRTPRRLDDIDTETREGRDLARSSPCLPRRPSLEREEAFCGERPAKKRCWSDEDPRAGDETERELYRLGLLYDNPHERGERFSFNSIVHDEPLYSINVRQSKRRAKCRGADRQGMQGSWHYGLPLELSFAALEDDERLARLLMAPDEDEVVGSAGMNRWAGGRGRPEERREVAPSLRVVYELEAENDEERGSRTQTATQSLPTSQDFPDLVFDSEHEEEEGVVEWEVLNHSESSSDGMAGPEAWVVLG